MEASEEGFCAGEIDRCISSISAVFAITAAIDGARLTGEGRAAEGGGADAHMAEESERGPLLKARAGCTLIVLLSGT